MQTSAPHVPHTTINLFIISSFFQFVLPFQDMLSYDTRFNCLSISACSESKANPKICFFGFFLCSFFFLINSSPIQLLEPFVLEFQFFTVTSLLVPWSSNSIWFCFLNLYYCLILAMWLKQRRCGCRDPIHCVIVLNILELFSQVLNIRPSI